MLTLGELESNGIKRNLSSEVKVARLFLQGFSLRIKANATKHWTGWFLFNNKINRVTKSLGNFIFRNQQ